jgi:hypothetical protein
LFVTICRFVIDNGACGYFVRDKPPALVSLAGFAFGLCGSLGLVKRCGNRGTKISRRGRFLGGNFGLWRNGFDGFAHRRTYSPLSSSQ